jgi:sec-independent protein translocase protein TatC
MSPSPREPEQLAEGTLISHLLELRTRLMRAAGAVVLIFIPLVFFANDLFTLIARPLMARLPEGTSLIATGVVSPFMTPLKLALITALFIAMPVVLHQVWAFVAPGLYRQEKRFAAPLLISSILLFYAGVAFAYFVVFPLLFAFLTKTTPEGVRMMTDMASYLDFSLLLFFAFGLAFEMPVATVLLVASGLVSVSTLKRNRGYVVLGIFVVAAFLTPPDAISQTLMAVPMYILYEIGIFFSGMIEKNRAEDPAEAQAAGSDD